MVKMNFILVALFSALLAYTAMAGTIMREGLNASVASNCGGNCPGGNCPDCPCGTGSNYVDVASWCARYGGWSQVRFICDLHQQNNFSPLILV